MTNPREIPLDARIYVAGHRGLVGSAVVRRLAAEGFRNLLEQHLEQLIRAMVAGESDRAAARTIALADLATMIGALTLSRALGATPFSDELLAAAKAAIR